MTAGAIWAVVAAAVLVGIAALLSAAETAIAHVSRVRVEELVAEGRPRARRLADVVAGAPRYLSGLLFLRTLAELLAVTLVAVLAGRHLHSAWQAVLVAGIPMALISFTVVGVVAATLGREH